MDLNYAGGFNRMSEEMLFLANAGVEVLRSTVAFIWKQWGRVKICPGNIPIRPSIRYGSPPALFFKSEAIVHQMMSYVILRG